MLNLRHLQHLVALADERHFARAAERVNLSQPAFSRSIQAVEAQTGLQLFEREAGAIRPTPAGEFLIERARRLLFDARCVLRDVELFRDTRLGNTAIGVGPLPALTLMPEVVAALRRQCPEVGLRVEVNNWRLLLDRLQAEDIEFFVADVRDLPADATLDIRALGRQPGGLYVRAGHPLAGRTPSLAEVWSFGVASVRLPEAVTTALARLMGLPAGASTALALQCDDIALLRSAMLHTDTVLALTAAAMREDVDHAVAVALQVRDLPALFSEMGVVRLRNRSPSPAAQKVVSLIEARAAQVNLPPGANAPR
jgi:DNA-binding transcriptional LysR family regulator